MKFALITADPSHKKSFRINPNSGDGTSFMSWVFILQGIHLSYSALREEDNSYLKDFDVVMMSGHPSHIEDIIRISKYLKDSNAVSMFYPEGSAQLYDNNIRQFQPLHFEAMASCDILSIAEEDKYSYYKSIVGRETIVKFIHVPMLYEMEHGDFRIGRTYKRHGVIVYGDNNPNHPLIASLCAKAIGADIWAVEWGLEKAEQMKDLIHYDKIWHFDKMPQYQYLSNLGRTIVNFYPTEWIGTARQQISCAVVGTPCIGNHDSHTQRRLFPKIGCDIYDIDAMVYQANKLSNENSYYDHVTEFAWNEVQFYSLVRTMERFTTAVDLAQSKKKNKVAV